MRKEEQASESCALSSTLQPNNGRIILTEPTTWTFSTTQRRTQS